jgi:flagellar FliL protein
MSDATSSDQAAPAPTGLKAKLPLAAAVVIGLAIGAGSGAIIVGPMAANTMGYATPAPAGGGDHAADEHADEGDEHAEGDSSSGAPPAVMTLENLVLNPAGSGGSRFLLLTVSMECKDADAVTTLQARDAELRDVVLSSLGQKSVDELADIAGRDVIKEQLAAALNERFGAKTVVRVYFPQYVVQ